MIKYRVITDSMEPLIPVGSEIELRKFEDQDKIELFDILVFMNNGKLICHYFWHSNEVFDRGLIVTRCLKNKNLDEPFERKNILGIVINYKISFWMKLKIIIGDKFSSNRRT
jgi:hypothetical protein